MEVTITRGTKRMNANHRRNNKTGQNKIHSSNFLNGVGKHEKDKGNYSR